MVRLGRADLGRRTQPERRSQPGAVADRFPAGSREAYGADTLVSVGVLVSGIVIRLTGWYAIDPVVGIAIALVILFSTSKLLHDSLRLSLDGVPVGIDSERVRRSITETDPRIEDVHHVHIWAISTTQNALTAHVVVRSLDDAEELKHEIKHRLEHEGIGHATLEFELCGEHCAKECPECR